MPSARLVLLLVTLLALPASASAAAASPPAPVPLDEGWEHLPDAGDVGLRHGWHLGDRGSGWAPVRVPHVFQGRPVEDAFGGTVGWYRLRFTGPAAPTGWRLRFEQVRRRARVWLNGRELGGSDDPYTPFRLTARGLRRGASNTLVLRVDNRKSREPREGWWNWGGITRPVQLEPVGAVAVDDLALLSRMRCTEHCTDVQVLVDARMTNRTASPVRPTVSVRLRAPQNGAVTRRTVRLRTLAPGAGRRVRFAVPVAGRAHLWSPEHPQLYDALVQTRVSGRVEHAERLRAGLRSVDVRNGMLHLNGRPLDLRGASIQEDMEGRGPALTDEDVERIVTELREVGANVTRAHYLLNERLLQRFDEEGILVWNQAPVYHRDVLLRTPAGRARELATLRRTVAAARRHPSVITHSVANELSPKPDAVPATRRWLVAAAHQTRRLDPTLPVSVDLLSYPGFPRQRTYEHFDLLGINSYFGWYDGKPGRHSTADLDDLRPFLISTHRKYPRHALVVTEFGAESTMDGPAARKETYAFQTRYLQRNLEIVGGLDFMGGAIYWTLREFAVKPDWDGGAKRDVPRDGIHNKGLITYDGRPKPAWSAARASFRSTPLYRSDDGSPVLAGTGPPRSFRGVLLGILALAGLLGGLVLWRTGPQPPASPARRRPERQGVKRTVITSPSRIT